ncbi:hypothetical protein ACHCAK_08795, partial [Raoultella ornithinolytica]|uniref:hypothetical protein n=1 Tax=Raoultella ornithinolytica TaxID=54291 RepID=UPI0037513188
GRVRRSRHPTSVQSRFIAREECAVNPAALRLRGLTGRRGCCRSGQAKPPPDICPEPVYRPRGVRSKPGGASLTRADGKARML